MRVGAARFLPLAQISALLLLALLALLLLLLLLLLLASPHQPGPVPAHPTQGPDLCCASSAAATTAQAPAASPCKTPACATARATTTNASTTAASAWWVGVHPSAPALLLTDLPNACPCTSWHACLHSQPCVLQCPFISLQGGYIKACPAGTYCMGSNNGENPCKPLLQATPSPCPNGENWCGARGAAVVDLGMPSLPRAVVGCLLLRAAPCAEQGGHVQPAP